jgi:hypothetical protein
MAFLGRGSAAGIRRCPYAKDHLRLGTTYLHSAPAAWCQVSITDAKWDGAAQHSTMLTASPPRAVSLYLIFMSAPVCIIVLMTLSRLTVWRPSP